MKENGSRLLDNNEFKSMVRNCYEDEPEINININININDLVFNVTGVKDFYGKKASVNITCPSNLTYIDYSIFGQLLQRIKNILILDLLKVENINLNKGIKEIGSYAFDSAKMKQIDIPSTVVKIGDGAFSWCGNLKEVIFSEGLKEIGKSAFRNDKKITY